MNSFWYFVISKVSGVRFQVSRQRAKRVEQSAWRDEQSAVEGFQVPEDPSSFCELRRGRQRTDDPSSFCELRRGRQRAEIGIRNVED